MRDVTKSWDKINSSRKGAGDSKSSCLWCQLYRFLVRGQAREMIDHPVRLPGGCGGAGQELEPRCCSRIKTTIAIGPGNIFINFG